ncbi:MAG: A/G-specific adenine glycosylase [Treponema sp.]|jgi:A/G-specific adenine glycosylase|nr:A/G-specific adenine glycosylase [Treponema sp.]
MSKDISAADIGVFQDAVYSHYKKEGRVFPWRQDTRPWGVLVSEFMLQQTQTARVVQYWTRWMKKWPTPRLFHKASMEAALQAWNGLGYNRRCYHLKGCARRIVNEYDGEVPEKSEDLEQFPGIGPYTARAVPCFAYNIPAVFIETNIRAAVLHFFFKDKTGITDKEIHPVLEACLDRTSPRTWYYALMDYGAALKKLTPNPNRRSAHYTRQTPFKGSFRQFRGAVLRSLARDGQAGEKELLERSGIENVVDLYRVIEVLENENMVAESGGIYRIRGENEQE